MPLPFILGGAAALVGLAGIALAVDGMDNKEKAEKTLEEAKTRYNSTKEKLDSEQESVQNQLEALGQTYLAIAKDFEKFEIIVDELLDRLDINKDKHLTLNLPEYKLNQIKALTVNFNSAATNIAGGAAAGTLASFAAYSGVMAFGTASTGTAIAGLSGAAAKTATLAALGGGSLAAGGFGIAGGMAVLGGVVAAPALALMGWAYSSETEDALNKAQESLEEVITFEEKSATAIEYLDRTYRYIHSINLGVGEIYKQFQYYYDNLQHVSKLLKARKLNLLEEQDHLVTSIQNGYALAAILTDVMTTPIFKLKNQELFHAPGSPLSASKDHLIYIPKTIKLNNSHITANLKFLKKQVMAVSESEYEIEQAHEAFDAMGDGVDLIYAALIEGIQAVQNDLHDHHMNLINEKIEEFSKAFDLGGIIDLHKVLALEGMNDCLRCALLEPSDTERDKLIQEWYDRTGFGIEKNSMLDSMIYNTGLASFTISLRELHKDIMSEMGEQYAGVKNIIKEALVEQLDNDDFKELIDLMGADARNSIIQDLNSMVEQIHPATGTVSVSLIPILDNFNVEQLLSFLNINFMHEDNHVIEERIGELLQATNEKKSEISEMLDLRIELIKTGLLIDYQIEARKITSAIYDHESHEFSEGDALDLERLELIGISSNLLSALIAETEEDFDEAIENLCEHHSDFFDDQDQAEVSRTIGELRYGLMAVQDKKAQEEKKELRQETLSDLNIDKLIERFFGDLKSLNQYQLDNLKKVFTAYVINHIDDALISLAFKDNINKLEFEQVDGMNVLNEDEMNEVLASAEEASAQYA